MRPFLRDIHRVARLDHAYAKPDLLRAASRAPPRRGAHYAAPEVPSVDRLTPERMRARPVRLLINRARRSREPAPLHSPPVL